LSDETVWYTATNPGALTTGALVKGERYQIEVWGTWGWSRSSGALADAECSVSPTDATWRRNRSVHPNGPDADHLDLYLDGIDLTGEPDKDAGDRCDSANHFYRAEFVPDRTGRMTFKLWDPTGLADNSGYLGIRIVRYATPNVMTMTVDARARAGRSTPGALKAGETYLVTVTGTVSVGNGVRSDAECSTTPTDPVWRRRRSLLPAEPNADHLDLLFNKDNRSGAPAVRSVADRNCDVATHRYAYVLRPAQTRPINLRVNDPVPGGNWGVLTVRFDRVVRETVSVVASSRTAAQTRGTYPANVPLNIRAIGEYAAGGGILADAECSRATATANWLTAQPTWRDRNGRSLGDVMVNGTLRAWRPTSGSGECDSVKHDYKLSATPTTASKVGFLIADTNRADNSGRILVSVELG
jgi:hypothetical protein